MVQKRCHPWLKQEELKKVTNLRAIMAEPYKPFREGNKHAVGHGRPKSKVIERFRWDVTQICLEHGFNPFERLIEMANNTKNKQMVRLKAIAELASYVAPKLKQVEFKGEGDSPLIVTLNLGTSRTENDGNSS